MIKRVVFSLVLIFVLSSCNVFVMYEISQETENYREFKMIADKDEFHDYDIAKQDIWEHEFLKAEEGNIVSLTTNDCDVSEYGVYDGWHTNHLIDCADQQYILKAIERNDENNTFPEAFGLYKNDLKIFESPMLQGSELDPIIKAQSLGGQLILSFNVMSLSSIEDNNVLWEMFWEGGVPSEFSHFEQMRAVFEYNDRIGFLATDPTDNMTYLYYDGKKVSPAYDSVRLTTCCAMDPHVYALHSNGAFLLAGKRNDEFFLTEIDL